jgi:hypothetical protein
MKVLGRKEGGVTHAVCCGSVCSDLCVCVMVVLVKGGWVQGLCNVDVRDLTDGLDGWVELIERFFRVELGGMGQCDEIIVMRW